MRYILLATVFLPTVTLHNSELMYCPVPWSPPPKQVKVDPKEVKCLATTIYGEARGEHEQGLAAVAYTVVNRAVNKRICQVILEPMQYSVYNDNPELQAAATSLRINPPIMSGPDKEAWKESLRIALAVIKRDMIDPTNGATHYISPMAMKALGYPYPSWTKEFQLMVTIENHKFYKQPVKKVV